MVCRRDPQHEGTRGARSGGRLTMNTGVSIRFTSLQHRSFISPHRDLLSQIARYVADQSHDDASVWLPDEWLLGHSKQLKIADTVSWPEDIHKPFLLSYLRLEVNKAIASQVLLPVPSKKC